MLNDLIERLIKAKEAFERGDIQSTIEASIRFNDLTWRPLLEAIKAYSSCLSAYSERCVGLGMRPQDLLVREKTEDLFLFRPGQTLLKVYGGTYELISKGKEDTNYSKGSDSFPFMLKDDPFPLAGAIHMPLLWWIEAIKDSNVGSGRDTTSILSFIEEDHNYLTTVKEMLWLEISKALSPYLNSKETVGIRVIETILPSMKDHAILSLGSVLTDSRLDNLFIRLLIQDDTPSKTVYLLLDTGLISRAQGIEITSLGTRRYAELPRLVLPRKKCHQLKTLASSGLCYGNTEAPLDDEFLSEEVSSPMMFMSEPPTPVRMTIRCDLEESDDELLPMGRFEDDTLPRPIKQITSKYFPNLEKIVIKNNHDLLSKIAKASKISGNRRRFAPH